MLDSAELMFMLQDRAECRCSSRCSSRSLRRSRLRRRHSRQRPRLLTPAGRDGPLDVGEGVGGAGG